MCNTDTHTHTLQIKFGNINIHPLPVETDVHTKTKRMSPDMQITHIERGLWSSLRTIRGLAEHSCSPISTLTLVTHTVEKM